ncbi:MAG: hypothetical protein AAGE94_07965 [Acidobacteriota bacterium]
MRHTILLLDLLLLATCALAVTVVGCRTPETPSPSIESLPAHATAPTDAETPTPIAGSAPSADEPTRAAIRRALPVLAAEGWAWMRGEVAIQDGQACVSCHHVNYAVWSLHEARRIGLDTSVGELDALITEATAFVDRPSTARSMSIGPMLLGLGHDPTTLVDRLIDLQTQSGRWRARGQFPDQRRPVEESDAVATLWSLLVLPADSLRANEAAESALSWLLDADRGDTNEWLAGQMLLAAHLDRPAERDRSRIALRAAQNTDGGWGWRRGEASNAFSTGQALYALARIGQPTDPRAHDYLIANQQDDGWWSVPSAAISREPTAERDQIYRFWGTAWATIGLARSSERRPALDRLASSRPMMPSER